MSTTSDSADEFVKFMLDGTEVALRLSGSLAKEMAVMLYAMSKEQGKKTKGQIRLENMLKSNSNLKIFSINQENFQEFKKQAKKYGVVYSALYKRGEKVPDKLIDILVREEDAERVNRIVERYKLTTVKKADIEKALEEDKQSNKINTNVTEEIKEKNTSQDLLNKLLKKENKIGVTENVTPSSIQNTEKNSQLENLLKTNEEKTEYKEIEKPSIREKLKEIKEEKKKTQEESSKNMIKPVTKELKHKQPKDRNKKKERSK